MGDKIKRERGGGRGGKGRGEEYVGQGDVTFVAAFCGVVKSCV